MIGVDGLDKLETFINTPFKKLNKEVIREYNFVDWVKSFSSMKKLIIASIVTLMLSSCAVGTYMPGALNNYGTQTQVVLSGANFRIVRDVEVVIEVDNSNLKRQDVERSAYGELLRQYKLKNPKKKNEQNFKKFKH